MDRTPIRRAPENPNRELPVSSASTETASLTDRLYNNMGAQIRSGGWAPGERLPTQRELSEREAVSRTVVREAVARLSAQGLLTPRHGSGVYVADEIPFPAFQIGGHRVHELADVIKLLEFRLAIETEMAGFAAARRSTAELGAIRDALTALRANAKNANATARADFAFHRAIAQASHNPHYADIIDFLGLRLVPLRTIAFANQPASAHDEYFARIDAEHQSIVDAITRMNPEAARHAARHHMLESLARHCSLAEDRGPVGT